MGTTLTTTLRIQAIALLLAVAGCTGNVASSGGPEGIELNPIVEPMQPSITDTLGELGIETDLGERVDVDGEPLRDGYHPLGTPITTLESKLELYVAGHDDTTGAERLLDDAAEGFAPMEMESASSDEWAALAHKRSTAADVDADGADEIAVAYLAPSANELRLTIIDPGDGTRVTHVVDADPPAPTVGIYSGNLGWPMALASGDLDADGRDELMVGLGNVLYVLADVRGELQMLYVKEYADANQVYVAAGDLDGDPQDELVVSWSVAEVGYYAVYDGDLETPIKSENLRLQFGTTVRDGAETWVTLGDVDGDRIDEIVFFGRRAGSHVWDFFVMDDARTGFALSEDFTSVGDSHYDANCTWFFGWHCDTANTRPNKFAVLDYDGDGASEILAHNGIFAIVDGAWASIVNLPANTSEVAVGDMDDDMADDIAFVEGGALLIQGRDADSGNHIVKHTQAGTAGALNDGLNARLPTVTLTMANTDGDSRVLRYDGDHRLTFTDATIISAVSAPPCDASIQDPNGCTTTFGQANSESVEEEHSLGFKVGFSVGAEWSDPTDLFGFNFEVAVENVFDFTTAHSSSVTTVIRLHHRRERRHGGLHLGALRRLHLHGHRFAESRRGWPVHGDRSSPRSADRRGLPRVLQRQQRRRGGRGRNHHQPHRWRCVFLHDRRRPG